MITIRKIIGKIFYLCGYTMEMEHGIQIKKLYPRPFAEFGLKGKNLIGAEIGVFEGEHAKSLLRTGKVGRLYLIDPYEEYDQIFEHIDKSISDKALRKSTNVLKNYLQSVMYIKSKSNEAVNYIPDKLDFVYVDGLHDYKSVKKDIENYWKKIKFGGVIGGHDIISDDAIRSDIGVIRAVVEFAVKHDLKVYIKNPDWWIFK